MHSKMRTKTYFPKLFPFISSLYHEELNDSTLSYIEDVQKDIDMDDFGKLHLSHAAWLMRKKIPFYSARKTYPSYYISGCVYLGFDCSRNWTMTMTMYGYCLQVSEFNMLPPIIKTEWFGLSNPENTVTYSNIRWYSVSFQFIPWKPSTPKTTIGRQYFLSVSIKTNDSDWLTGWKSYMEGFTVFYRFSSK